MTWERLSKPSKSGKYFENKMEQRPCERIENGPAQARRIPNYPSHFSPRISTVISGWVMAERRLSDITALYEPRQVHGEEIQTGKALSTVKLD